MNVLHRIWWWHIVGWGGCQNCAACHNEWQRPYPHPGQQDWIEALEPAAKQREQDHDNDYHQQNPQDRIHRDRVDD